MNNRDSRNGNAAAIAQHQAKGIDGAHGVSWEAAMLAAHAGDDSFLVSHVAKLSGYTPTLVAQVLGGDADEPVALIARVADLPWAAFEALVSWRARRFSRGAGSFGAAIRLFRDTSVMAARHLARSAWGEPAVSVPSGSSTT